MSKLSELVGEVEQGMADELTMVAKKKLRSRLIEIQQAKRTLQRLENQLAELLEKDSGEFIHEIA